MISEREMKAREGDHHSMLSPGSHIRHTMGGEDDCAGDLQRS